MVFKSLAKMQLKTKDVPHYKLYLFILHLLGKEDLHCWESFPLAGANNNDKEQPDHVWQAFEGTFRQTFRFRSYSEQA